MTKKTKTITIHARPPEADALIGAILASGKSNLVLASDAGHKCTCGADASQFVKCRTCKAVIARCTQHGGSSVLADLQRKHCP